MLTLFREQPRAFNMIFMLEIWERFGFYTVQGILTLYFIRTLGLDENSAYYTFGAFSALVYGMVAIGGYLGDQILGTKRTIVLGLITLAAGYLSLSLAGKEHVYLALGLICVGNGLFKANPSNLLSKCYAEDDERLHSGFTLYYMAINFGAIFALFVGPTLSSRYGYFYAYFASFIGIMLGLANYIFQRQHIANIKTTDRNTVHFSVWIAVIMGIVGATLISSYLLQHVMTAKNLLLVITSLVILTYFNYMRREQKKVILKMLVAFLLMLEAVTFFTLYQQMPTSLNLFAVNNVNSQLLGMSIDPQSLQALNPIWIIIMSPFLALSYKKIHQCGFSFAIPYKFALGMTFCGLSFMILYFARFAHNDAGIVSSGWLVVSYLFQSLGELLVSALGVAMVAELVPGYITGFVMGMWFLTSAMAGFIGAYVASFTSLPANIHAGVETLTVYTQVFAYIGIVTLGIALLMWLMSPLLTRLISVP